MRRLLTALAIALAPGPALAAEDLIDLGDAPALFVRLAPDGVAAAGLRLHQELVMTVRVASPWPFEALDLVLPEIAGAETRTLVRPRTRLLRSYAGEHTVLETTLAIYPTRTGPLVLPPVRVTGMVSPGGEERRFAEASAPVEIAVAGIPPGYLADWWMVGRAVRVTEEWSAPLAELREGDVVRRTVTVVAEGVPDDRMPVLEHRATRGIAVAPAGAARSTEHTAGGAIGTVRQEWDIRIEQGGMVYLPPIGVSYWDPAAGRARTASAPGHRVEPLPADAAAIAAALMREARAAHAGARGVFLLVLGLLALPIAALALAFIRVLVPSRADLALWRACRAGAGEAALYRAVHDWSARSGVALAGATADGELVQLSRVLFSGAGGRVRPRRLAATLLARSRRARVSRLNARMESILRAIFGPLRHLDPACKS